MSLLALLLLQPELALAPPAPAEQAAVQAYQRCLTPIVRANALAEGAAHQPLEMLLQRIAAGCSAERAAAKERLSAYVFRQVQRVPTDADKEQLIHEATIRWANGIVTTAVVETLERK